MSRNLPVPREDAPLAVAGDAPRTPEPIEPRQNLAVALLPLALAAFAILALVLASWTFLAAVSTGG